MDTFKKILSSARKYIFIILSLIFFYIALFFRDVDLLSVFVLLNILSILVIVNIFSKLKYSFILFLLLVVACTVDTFFAFYYKNHILFGILASILETNWDEAVGVSMTMFPVWASIFIICFLLLFFAKKEMKEISLSIKSSLLLLAGYFILLISSLFFSIYTSGQYLSESKINIFTPMSTIAKKRAPLIYYTIPDLGSYYKEMSGYKQYETDTRTLPEGVKQNKEKAQLEKVYLIIGESSSSKYFSLYGYPQKTTPFLDSLRQHNTTHFFAFEGFTPAPLTREAIRLTLAYTTVKQMDNFYKYKNIIELANDSQYQTLWLSNQYRGGIYDTYIVMIARKANYSRFEINPIEDFSLIDVMQEFTEDNKKQFFVLHTTGSHIPYSNGSDSIDIKKFPGKGTKNEYIRTIHHVDRVIEKVYNIVKNDTVPSALFYFSDHGEAPGKGHGVVSNVTPDEIEEQFSVPLICIINDAAKGIVTNSVFEKFYDKETQKVSTQNVISIISECIGYDLNDSFVEQSIEDGRYIYHEDTQYYYKDIIKK